MIRVTPALRNELQRLADDHRRGNLSQEVKTALSEWVRSYEFPQLYNSALARAVRILVERIEHITGRRWCDDPLTRELVRVHVVRLIDHLLPPAPEPPDVPADIKGEIEQFLTVLLVTLPRPDSPRFKGVALIDDPGLVTTLQDLSRDLGRRIRVETRPEMVAAREKWEKEKGN
jgi:hypothetical protein